MTFAPVIATTGIPNPEGIQYFFYAFIGCISIVSAIVAFFVTPNQMLIYRLLWALTAAIFVPIGALVFLYFSMR